MKVNIEVERDYKRILASEKVKEKKKLGAILRKQARAQKKLAKVKRKMDKATADVERYNKLFIEFSEYILEINRLNTEQETLEDIINDLEKEK